MRTFTQHTGLVAPLSVANVDTDAIIPKQFLQKITREGFGQHLFHDWRFLDNDGVVENPDFVLNQAVFQGASILLARENFGCGSSREHAPWALMDFGFNVIIAPSFADIFYGNALNNHLLVITLPPEQIDALFTLVDQKPGITFTVDLVKQTIQAGQYCYPFAIDTFRRHCLINGLDNIGLTLQHEEAIKQYEENIPPFFR